MFIFEHSFSAADIQSVIALCCLSSIESTLRHHQVLCIILRMSSKIIITVWKVHDAVIKRGVYTFVEDGTWFVDNCVMNFVDLNVTFRHACYYVFVSIVVIHSIMTISVVSSLKHAVARLHRSLRHFGSYVSWHVICMGRILTFALLFGSVSSSVVSQLDLLVVCLGTIVSRLVHFWTLRLWLFGGVVDVVATCATFVQVVCRIMLAGIQSS